MSAFDTGEMAEALADTTNVQLTLKKEEARKVAQEKGWVEPSNFNYAQYNSSGGASGEATDVPDEEWAHTAVKYEWKEEYGDLGPEIPELEDQLFRSQYLTRMGIKFNK